jgi:sulfur carrier protein
MIVVVNEKKVEVDDQTTVAALLASLGFPDRGVAVAMDDGARLEVVTAVQGG